MNHILWFRQVLEAAIQLYFRQEEVTVNSIYDIPAPKGDFWQKICGTEPAFDEQVVLMLAGAEAGSPNWRWSSAETCLSAAWRA